MNNTVSRLSGLLVLLVWCAHLSVSAQDTLRITLPELEQLFIQKNLSLLAQRYNIDMARAEVVQQKLYPNPNFQFTGNAYNPVLKKAPDWSNATGQYVFDLQQLIVLAGKRNKQIRMAQTNVVMEENEFFDLLRTLRFSLRSDFYSLYFLQHSIDAYRTQINYLESLKATYDDFQDKGIVTLKDAVRIKSLLYTLKAERALLQNEASNLNAELTLFIQNNSLYLLPQAVQADIPVDISRYPVSALLDSAYQYRADLKKAQTNVLLSKQNYSLQKAMAVPDLTLGAEFDKRGSFVDNATFISAAIDLPFFHRNQGNIKSARIRMDQSDTELLQKNQSVESEVLNAYLKVLNTDKTIQSFDASFIPQFQQLLQAVTENFQKKNISLLEFTDFYQSYKENILQFNQLHNERIQATEALQFAIGKNIFNPY